MIIGLIGYASSGKDTAALGLVKEGWQRVAFADALRELAIFCDPLIETNEGMEIWSIAGLVEQVGWEEAKQHHTVREFLQNLGTGVREILNPDSWINKVRRTITETDKHVVVTDARFPNEFEVIRSLGGHLVRVDRPGCEAVNGHVSESYVADAIVDAVLLNHSTPETLQETLVMTVGTLACST